MSKNEAVVIVSSDEDTIGSFDSVDGEGEQHFYGQPNRTELIDEFGASSESEQTESNGDEDYFKQVISRKPEQSVIHGKKRKQKVIKPHNPSSVENRQKKYKKRSKHLTPTVHNPKSSKDLVGTRIQNNPGHYLARNRMNTTTLFCEVCKRVVQTKATTVTNHIKGKKHLDAVKKRKLNDAKNPRRKYIIEQHFTSTSVGKSLAPDVKQFRVSVLECFLKSMTPLYRLRHFKAVFEESGKSVGDVEDLRKWIPLVRKLEVEEILKEIENRYCFCIFDGTPNLCECEVVLLRYINDWSPCQRVVRLKLLQSHLNGESCAGMLLDVLTRDCNISNRSLITGFGHDCASVNSKAMDILKPLFPHGFDSRCCSHTIDHVGEHFDIPELNNFISFWINSVCRSGVARRTWKNKVGKYPENPGNSVRWWCKFECMVHIGEYWGDMLPFLIAMNENDIAHSNCAKMIDVIERDGLRLEVQICAIIDASLEFIKATYFLEGDGCLIFFACDVLMRLKNHCEIVLSGHFPNVKAHILQKDPARYDYWMIVAFDCIRPGIEYFNDRIFGEEYSNILLVLKSARYFYPPFAKSLALNPAQSVKVIDDLRGVVWCEEWDYGVVVAEFCLFITFLQDWEEEYEFDPYTILSWWKKQTFTALKQVVLYLATFQVSSAASERAISVLSRGFKKGNRHYEDYVETSVLLSYNCERRNNNQ